ncbi:MAG: hypothetical protein M0Z53_11890 [Thermaerobacter sp.]|nr:hypothetical protein [Thermaerobacter sp.]
MTNRRRRGRTRLIAGVAVVLASSLVALPFLMTSPVTPAHAAAGPRPASVATPFRTPANRPATLPPGPVVVETFATWCEYCATTAKWEDAADAQAAHRAHVSFVMVDVSPESGIGQAAQAPTRASIARTAHDGAARPAPSTAALAQAVRAFLQRYPVPVPVLFDPAGPPTAWRVTAFPTFLWLNARHQVVDRLVGWQPPGAVARWIRSNAPQH